jgi:hypothetical protein
MVLAHQRQGRSCSTRAGWDAPKVLGWALLTTLHVLIQVVAANCRLKRRYCRGQGGGGGCRCSAHCAMAAHKAHVCRVCDLQAAGHQGYTCQRQR